MTGKVFTTFVRLGGVLKSRPSLIIGKTDADDYVILPISKISNRRKINPEYDLPLNSSVYPILGLTESISYIRTHKPVPVHISDLKSEIGDMKSAYPDLFLQVLERYEDFSRSLIDDALTC
jgi:hypothetical protein